MAYWLLKTEPESYSYDDLEKQGKTSWEGVRNFRAAKHLRTMQVGDLAFIYHTGKERAIIGVGEIATPAYPDPQAENARFVAVDVIPRYRLARPVTLAEIKQNIKFSSWELVNQPRLSVMPVKEEYWTSIEGLSQL